MKFLALAAGLAAAGALAQFPEVSQQYIQRLSGAVEELAVVVEDFDNSAQAAGLTRADALAELSGTAFLNARSADMMRTIQRYEALSADLTILQTASPVERLLLMPARLDSEIGARAMQDFVPAIPVTATGLTFAGIGFGAGYVLLLGLGGLFRRRSPKLAG